MKKYKVFVGKKLRSLNSDTLYKNRYKIMKL